MKMTSELGPGVTTCHFEETIDDPPCRGPRNDRLRATLPLTPEKVYAAWSDAAQRARWHFPGDDGWELAEFDQDFRVGGHERSRFGLKGAPHLREEGRFLDIVPNERIVSAGAMHENDLRVSITLCTVEIAADGNCTLLKLTDQSAFLDGRERPDERRSGWGAVLDRLADLLRSTSTPKE